MFNLNLEKVEEPEMKLVTSFGSLKKQESSGKKKHTLDYDLNDREETQGSANGATPSLVRYNTPVMLPRPSLKGHDFVNWSLVSVKDYDRNDVANHSYDSPVSAGSAINVKHRLVYQANWSLSETIYTIVYWLEDADSTNSDDKSEYNVW